MHCSNCESTNNVIHWIPLKGSDGTIYAAWVKVCDSCYNDYLTVKRIQMMVKK